MTRTPLRVSFAGGGTDLPAFYEREWGGVLSTAIDKYVYVTVKRHGALFDEPIRLNYSETEIASRVDDIRNAIARECIRLLEVGLPCYVSVVSDVPAFTGLGSSSSFAVGLLNALHAFRGERVSKGQLAEEAARVELEVLRRPMGKQDHYAASYGGLNFLRFQSDGGVAVEAQRLPEGSLDALFAHIMMFWTGIFRDSTSVLAEQSSRTPQRMDDLLAMREHAVEARRILAEGFDAEAFGRVLGETWERKRRLASAITSDRIDGWYRRGMEAGALGGKLCGAGGGGFLLFIVPPGRHSAMRATMEDLTQVEIGHDVEGSRLLFPAKE
ncbi:MAG: GHMP kinase [Planctomycetes bacterium]|nr:GHMP kinase [Planctomycetota bacterium]